MDKYKIGDRVILADDSNELHPEKGSVGTVVRVDGDGCPLVKWDDTGYINAVCEWKLAPLPCREVPVPKLEHKVLIMQDRDDPFTVKAKDLSTGEVGYARCAPEDEFHFDIGALIALGRLFGHEPEITKLGEPTPVAKPCKFKVGDKIIGNENANRRYGVTREGWIGEVTEILSEPEKGGGCDEGLTVTFVAKGKDGVHYWLSDDAFDLYEEPEEETVIHCNLEENARIIAMIMDFDAEGKVFDWYEQHIQQLSDWCEQQLRAHFKAEPEEPKYLTGKLVCTYSDYGIWTVGKVYPVVDGTIYDNKGAPRFKVESADQLTRRLSDPEGGEVRFVDLKPAQNVVAPPKKLEGKLVCIRSACGWWTEGKVYEAVNGVLHDNDGDATVSFSTLEACNFYSPSNRLFAFLKE
jgi:hypothetical protein